MSRKYLNKKNNGRFIKESKTKIRNNPTPRLHGDLSHLNIKELKTTGKRSQHHQAAASTRNKTICIDSVLPIPHSPYTKFIENGVIADEVTGGIDGGCKDNPTNLQEGVTKGWSFTHVLHEVIHIDHSTYLRPSATTTPMKNTQNTPKKHSQIQGVNSEQVQRDSGVKEAEKGAKAQIQEASNNLKGAGNSHIQQLLWVTNVEGTPNKQQ
ncbi:hypothetical protein KY285_021898 [Solanum tuberosum]|nr:hypothetical protein KY289_022765 [Solanum tuberosum]KAH0694801.1 hypothetical protein KY285_021898 [Solanum tuberosum]